MGDSIPGRPEPKATIEPPRRPSFSLLNILFIYYFRKRDRVCKSGGRDTGEVEGESQADSALRELDMGLDPMTLAGIMT